MKWWTRHGGAVIAAASALSASEAHCEADGADAPAPGDIIVTAQKRAERLEDVPVAVSVLDNHDLAEQGLVRFSDYASRVPGLSLTSLRTGQAQVTLRGITTGAAQSASSTGYYIDEAPIGSVNAYTGGSLTTPDLDPSDLNQIEVLKGPQGTLYGAGAVGGLLKFVTTSADLANYSADLTTTVDAVDHGGTGYALRGLVNLPIEHDVLALRLSGFYRHDAGYIENVNSRIGHANANAANLRGGRAALVAKLAPGIRLELSAMAQDTSTDGINSADVDAVTLQPIAGDLTQNRNVLETGKVKLRLYNATLRASVGGIDVVSSTTYQHTGVLNVTDGSRSYGVLLGGIGIVSTQITHTQRWSQELRGSKDGVAGGLLDLQAGVYWTHEKDSNRIPGFAPFDKTTGAPLVMPAIITASILSSYDEYSFFGSARVHVAAAFDVLGGVRYSHDRQTYAQDYAGRLVGPERINTGQETGGIVTWMISPRYRLSPDAMVYIRAASGYRPGGPNAVPPTSVFAAPTTFQPDRLNQYEVGFKAAAIHDRLTIDAALFDTIWNNIQIQTSAAGFNFFVNGGKARSWGGELTMRYRLNGALSLAANFAYTNARLISAATAAGGAAGDRLPYVPQWSGSVSADYRASLGKGLTARIGGSINAMSDRYSDYSLRFPKHLPGFATADLRAGIDVGSWSLNLFARNLTDSRAINTVATAALGPRNTSGAVYYASYNQPRTIGVQASIVF